MSKKRFINLLLLLFVCSVQAAAYDITGQVVDRTDGSELAGASVVVRRDSVSIVASAIADAQGRFAITGVAESDVIIDVQMFGYQGVRTAIIGNTVENIELGAVALIPAEQMLDEVTVTGSGVIQKPDRYLVIPSVEEVERSSSSLSLLAGMQMKLPGLRVNESLQQITVDNGSPVYMINGKQVPFSRILAINNDNVLRIEYRDSPDIRYADARTPGTINCIMKPAQSGGSVYASVGSALTTGSMYDIIEAIYNYKKSEWTFSFNNQWRNYDDRIQTLNEQFIGREKPITRSWTSLSDKFGYTTNDFTLGYSYMHDPTTMLSVTLNANLMYDMHSDQHNFGKETIGNEVTEQYLYDKKSDSSTASPSIDIFFRKQIDDNRQFDLDAFALLSNGDYDSNRNYDYEDNINDYSLLKNTDNKSWRTGLEGVYSHNYSHFTTSYGFRYYHNQARNNYSENSESASLERMNTDYMYVHGAINGRIKDFSYSAGIGGLYNHTGIRHSTRFALKPM